jgi:trk system potassium uptake protein TrkH
MSLGKREGILIIVLGWLTITLGGCLPFLFSGVTPDFTDAFFESMSGFTSTGASVIDDVESISRGVAFWRSVISWFGGMGIIIIIMFVAMIPSLGISSFMLYTAESTGVFKTHPRLKETARGLFAVYLALTVLCAFALYLCGLSPYDAIAHSFTTISTCGFSTFNSSVMLFTPSMQYVIIFFMIISSMSFNSLYFILSFKFKKKNLISEESKAFLVIIAVATLYIFVSLMLSQYNNGDPASKVFRDSLMEVVCTLTTTGFSSVNYLLWPSHIWFVLFLLFFIGGCSGSTAGGVKIVRYIILVKNSFTEMKRQIHPQAVMPVRYNREAVPQSNIYSIHAFFILYILVFIAGALAFAMMGLDFETSIGISIASLANVGPGIGAIGPDSTYAFLPAIGKWLSVILQFVGRLELFIVLIIFNKSFWVK